MGGAQLIAILRGFTAEQSVELALRAWDVGFDLVEVPIQSEQAWQSLQGILRVAEGRPVGAGTVLSVEQVHRAHSLGCGVIIAPNFSADILEECRVRDLDYWPGVMTPTEIAAAAATGATTLKVFPAGSLGPAYLRELRGPFPDLRLVAVGGVSLANAQEFVQSGADELAFGSSITEAVAPENLSVISALVDTLRGRDR